MSALPEEIRRRIEAIHDDHAHGAAALARKAADMLLLLTGSDARDLGAQIRAAAVAVVDAQPAMAPLIRLASDVLWRTESAGETWMLQTEVAGVCRDFIERLELADEQIVPRAAELIPEDATVITYSHSRSVRLALLHLHRNRRRVRAIVPESRPICEGEEMARQLGLAGVPATLIADGALWRFLPEANMAMVGADAVSREGVVNKAGTALLALAAREAKVPVYCLTSELKFLASPPAPETAKPPEELLAGDREGVTVANYYFDTTPLEWFTGFVTEEGVFTPNDIYYRARAHDIHPLLVRS